MNLGKKKKLATRTFGVGESRITFLKARLDEIKEAITKQDIRDLCKEGAIMIKPINGRKKIKKKKNNRSPGNVRKKIRNRKKTYVISTRKLRKYIAGLKKDGKLSSKEVIEIRKKIRNRFFKSKANLKEYLGGIK